MQTAILDQVEKVGARTEKERLLSQVDESTKRFLRSVADPFTTFGVTVDEEQITRLFASRVAEGNEELFWGRLDALLGSLAQRTLTGNAATEAIEALLTGAPTAECQKWAARIINQDLRLGVATKTILKVFPGLVEPFCVQLAHPYDPGKHLLEGNWGMEPKLDGLRMAVVDGKAYTRNGKDITSCAHILNQLAEAMDLSAWVLDGEVMGTEFNEASGQVRKSEACETLVYHVFDLIKRDEWASRKTAGFGARRLDLEDVLADGCQNVQVVSHTPLPKNPSAEEIFKVRDAFIAAGYEGIMLKNLQAPYEFKRTSALLKVKNFEDADGRVVGTFEGKGKYRGMLGGLVVDFDGVTTEVGSGFVDAQRKTLWQNRMGVIGKMVEVKYQNKSPTGCLRFPVFIKFRADLETT